MAQRRVSMKKAKEILRLKFEAGLGNHKIARACGISASTVWERSCALPDDRPHLAATGPA